MEGLLRRRGDEIEVAAGPPELSAHHGQESSTVDDFAREIEALLPDLKRYAQYLTHDAVAADDLVQETVPRGIKKIHLWRPGTDLRAWLSRIFHNLYVSGVRQAQRHRAMFEWASAQSLSTCVPRQIGWSFFSTVLAAGVSTPTLPSPIKGEGCHGRLQRDIPRLCDSVGGRSAVMQATVLNTRRASLHAWQDRLRDPSLTALLVLQLFLLFVALPLAATGVPIAAPVAWLLLLLAVTLVVVLSRRVGASVFILLGLAAAAASFAFGRQWSPITVSVLNHGGFILAFSALTWVVTHALYAPGRITFHRLQGAAVVYLSLATIFANAFGLVWGLVPGAFANLPPAAPGASEFDTMLYFSLATLTTTGFGDIVPLNPFARSLTGLESVVGPFYLAITVARLVTMGLEDRRRSRKAQ